MKKKITKCPCCGKKVFKIIKDGLVTYMGTEVMQLDRKFKGYRKHNCILNK